MPVAPLRDILDPAFEERYGVAAFNVVNDVSLQAVIDAATELESPLIVQTSVKTVKSIGANVLYADVPGHGRRGARADRPAPRPLPRARVGDDVPEDGLELRPVRRLAPRHRGEHAPDERGRRGGARLRRATSRARSRASRASRTTSGRTRRARCIPSRCR